MSNLNPTVVIAQLDDDKLRASIDSLVTHFNSQLEKMKKDSTSAVQEITQTLNKLGEIKVDMGGSANGGSSRRAKAQTEEAKAVKDTAMAYDQLAKVQQVAVRSGDSSSIRNADVLQTMNVQLDLLRERLREARQQYSSFVALAAHATTTGDKGLFQFATEGVHRYEQEVHNLIPQIRNLQTGIKQMGDVIAPQGHTMQNYVNSLQKTNPQLALLNEQFKSGKSLLQQQTTSYEAATSSAQKYTDEIRRQADIIRKSEAFKKDGTYLLGTATGTTHPVFRDSERSVEEQLLKIQKDIVREQEIRAKNEAKIKEETQGTAQTAQQVLENEKRIAQEQEKIKSIGVKQVGKSFEQMMGGKLGLKANEIESSAQKINKLNIYINQLQQTWSRLTPSMQKSDFGKKVKEEFQAATHWVQQLKKELSRPVNLRAAMGGAEKTLDDIAYKIQRLQSYKRGLDITNPTQIAEMKQVDAEIKRLTADMNKYMNTGKKVSELNGALGRSWNYMKNRLAFYFTVGASTQFVKNLIEVRSQYEMNERALGILIDSAERGTQIFNELSQMALVSPYTLIELSTAAKQLSAYDIAAKDLVDTTRRLADLSAAVGIPVERLTTALGQIKAFEHLTSLTARRFASAGIPLVKQLAEYYTDLKGKMVSVADVYDMMKKRQIGYNDVMQVIYRMTDEGGKFFDFQAKMAGTLKVQLANLTLAWNNMLNDIGRSQQGLLVGGIKGLKMLFLQWQNINTLIRNLAITFGFAKLAQIIKVATFGFDALGRKWVWNILIGKKLTNVIVTMYGALKTIITSPLTWWALLATAVTSAAMAFSDANEAVKALNKSIRDSASENNTNIQKTLDNLKSVKDSLYTKKQTSNGEIVVTNNINEKEAGKAWLEIREQIELSSKAGDRFVEKLLAIDDVNDRVREGFKYLEKIRDVYGVLQEIGDDTIGVKQDMSQWWNLWQLPDSVFENVKDLKSAIQEILDKYGSMDTFFKERLGQSANAITVDYVGALDNLRTNIDITEKSVIKFLDGKNLDAEGWREAFESINQKILEGSELTADEQLLYRIEAEKRFSYLRRKQFQEDRDWILKNTKGLTQEQIKTELARVDANEKAWFEAFGQSRADAEAFYSWLKSQHRSEIDNMFGRLSKKEIETLDKSVPKWREWIEKNAKEFSDRWGVSFNDLWKKINDTNQMKIFIKATIESGDGEKIYDTLTNADKTIDEALGKIERLTTRRNELLAKGASHAGITDEDAEYIKVLDEIKEAQDDLNKAREAGGHSKKQEKKDSKERKQAESELQKALKEEISLIDKVRSTYKTLTKEGIDSTTALTTAISGYDETVRAINSRLSRFGIAPLDLSKYAGVQNPREIMNMLQAQLNQLVKSGAAKPSEIKDLQVKLKDLKIDSLTFDHKTLTDSLNNELSKLKDEYELAVELDANPELGNIFTDIFDIDPNELPQNLDEYAERVTNALNKSFEKQKKNFRLPTIELTDDDLKAYKEESQKPKGLITEADYNEIEKQTKEIRNLRKKDREDTLKKTQELQYKLGELNDKIAIEEKKLANLQKQLARETNEEKRKLLELEIQDQEQAISKLKEQILSELPAYKALFESITDYSNGVVNRLAKNYKRVLDEAKKRGLNNNGKYTLTEGDVTVELTPERLNKEYKNVFKEIRKSESAFAKIKNAFTGDKKTNTQKDWAKGLELIAEEARKAADGVRTVAEIFDELGGDEDTTEVLNDIATSMDGISTAGQGVSQIASGDYIGGTVNVIKGAWQAISTWFDNDNKKIDRQIEKSKFKVKELELAYKKLEYAAKKALGTEETVAKRESIAVKEQELAELERQLALEQQKDYKKDSDKREQKERIQDYLDSIESLKQEIQDARDEIVNNLLGSDVKSAAEEFVDTWVEAWRAGETTLDAIQDKMDEVIFNLIKKAATSKIVETLLNPFYNEVNRMTSAESEMGDALTINELRQLAQMAGITAEQINTALGEFYGNLDALDIISQSSEANKQLSALQQGIQGITEDTAGALEAYMNGVSQQVYLHSQLLTEIRNAVVSMDNDIQMGIQAQMLLQLQQSYAVQMAIQNILLGWSNPSGMAVKVEMI